MEEATIQATTVAMVALPLATMATTMPMEEAKTEGMVVAMVALLLATTERLRQSEGLGGKARDH